MEKCLLGYSAQFLIIVFLFAACFLSSMSSFYSLHISHLSDIDLQTFSPTQHHYYCYYLMYLSSGNNKIQVSFLLVYLVNPNLLSSIENRIFVFILVRCLKQTKYLINRKDTFSRNWINIVSSPLRYQVSRFNFIPRPMNKKV